MLGKEGLQNDIYKILISLIDVILNTVIMETALASYIVARWPSYHPQQVVQYVHQNRFFLNYVIAKFIVIVHTMYI